MTNEIVANREISLTNFLNLLKEDNLSQKVGDIDYETLWRFVNSEEENLLKTQVISIEERRVNSKKKILDLDAFVNSLIDYLRKQKHLSISKFLKKSGLALSYTTLYRLIEEKEKELTKKNIVEISRNGNKKNIKIICSKKMESFLRENKIIGE